MISDEQHPEIDTWPDGTPCGKALGAQLFRPGIEALLSEKVVGSKVKGIAGLLKG